MAAPEPLYDLVLLLDTSAPEDQRKKVLTDVESAISTAGTIVNDVDWGTRALAYEIRHRTDAEYHLLQFHGPPVLLGEPAAHAAHRRRGRSLPDHQARAGHARPDRAAARRGAVRAAGTGARDARRSGGRPSRRKSRAEAPSAA